MAIVKKTSETRHRSRAKATIRYIMHRRERGERITRPLFSDTEGDRKRREAYEAIDKAPYGTRFLRVTLSPDPKREDTHRDLNFRELTRAMMARFQQDFPNETIQFFASVHEGHTDNRHVNMLVIFPGGRLTKTHWAAMREAAGANARSQRIGLDRERGETGAPTRFPVQVRMRERGRSAGFSSYGGSGRPQPVCPLCMGSMERQGRYLACDTCHISLSQSRGIGLEIRSNRRAFELEQEGSI